MRPEPSIDGDDARPRRRRWRLVAVAGLTATVLSGCLWSNPGYNVEGQGSNSSSTGITADNVASLRESWHRDVAGINALPVVESGAGLIHTAVGSEVPGEFPIGIGTAIGLRPADGSIVWQTRVPRGDSAAQSPSDISMVRGNVAVSVTPDCSVCSPNTVRFDARTGAVLDDDFTRGTYVLDAGERVVSVWSHVIGEPLGTEGRVGIYPKGSDPVFVPLGGNFGDHPVSRLAIGGDRAFFSLGQGLLGVDLDPADRSCGSPPFCYVGQAGLDGRGTAPVLSSDHDTVFVATAAGTLSAFDATDPAGAGSTYPLRWKASLGDPVTARPALSADGLVVATATGTVAVFDPEGCGAAACSPVWTTTVPGAVTEQPTIAGGLVYVASAATQFGPTTVSAFPVSCSTACSPLWSVDTGLVLSGPVVVSDRGRVFISGSVAGATGPVSRVIAYRPA